MKRRKYLAILGTVSSGAIAGCSSEETPEEEGNDTPRETPEETSDVTPEDTSTQEPDSTPTETPEETPTETPEELDPPEFEFTEIEPGEESLIQGESVTTSAIIENTGEQEGDVEIELFLDDEVVESQSVTIRGEEQIEIEYNVDTSDLEFREYDYRFKTENSEISSTLTILQPASFEFTNIEPDDTTVDWGELIEIEVTVENTGDVEGTDTIEYAFDGEVIDSTDTTLDAGEETSLSSDVDTEVLEEGESSYTFTSTSDEITGSIEVVLEEPDVQSYSGTGQTVEEGVDIEGGLTVVEATHTGDSNFVVSLVPDDGFDELFVNTIGEFDGAQSALLESGEYLLEVDAGGEWAIDIRQPRAASGDELPQSLSGTGASVLGPFEFEGTHIAEGSYTGESNFVAEVFPMEGSFAELIFNEIGEFEGETTFSFDDVGWIDISADGDWSLDIE